MVVDVSLSVVAEILPRSLVLLESFCLTALFLGFSV
jgi:hypothetical protein